MLWIYITIATLAIQIPNIWAIQKFNEEPSFKTTLYIALACLPASFIANVCYSNYYGNGFFKYSYPNLAVIAYGFSFFIAFVVQFFILKSKELHTIDFISFFIVFLGIGLSIFRENFIK